MSLYNKVQAVKAQNGQRGKGIKNGKLPFLYRGLIKCAECNSSITPERKKNKYHYYRCTQHYKKHDFKYVNENDLTEQICEVLDKVRMSKPDLERLLSVLRDSHSLQKSKNGELLNHFQAEYKKLANRISKAQDYLFDDCSAISAEDTKRKIEEYREKQIDLQLKIEDLQKSDESFYKNVESILKIVTNAGELFKSSGMDEKREILKLAFQNLQLDGYDLVYEWSPTFEKVAYCVSNQKWHARKDSNL